MKKYLKNITFISGLFVASFLSFAAISQVVISPEKVSAGNNICTWIGAGADNNWSTPGNWDCNNGTIPDDGYEILFPLQTGWFTTNNDITGNTYTRVELSGSLAECTEYSNGYAIWGDALQVAGDVIVDATGTDAMCNARLQVQPGSIRLNGDTSFIVNSAYSALALGNEFSGVIDVQTHTATFSSIQDGGVLLVTRAPLTGTGNVIIDANSYVSIGERATTNSISGSLTVRGGAEFRVRSSGLTSFSSVILESGAYAILDPCNENQDLAGHVVIPANLSFFDNVRLSLLANNPCASFPSQNEVYGGDVVAGWHVEFTGTVSFNSALNGLNEGIDQNAGLLSITGNLEAPGINILDFIKEDGDVMISTQLNNSNTPEGLYSPPTQDSILSDSQPSNTVYIGLKRLVYVNGQRGDVLIENGGILAGTGTVGNVESIGGVLQPGLSPGVLTTGSLDFDAGTVVDVEIGGTALGEYDQLDVTGMVSLGGATLNTSFWDGFVPSINDEFIIIQNDDTDAVVGTFDGLAEGATFVLGDVTFSISYVGGTGNDVVLTVTDAPGPPPTGFMTLQSNVLLPVMAVVGGMGILGIRRVRAKFSK